MPKTGPQLIVALDNCSVAEARAIVTDLSDAGVRWFKVGLELYTLAGPAFVEELKKQGKSVFLDLKLHDIPNTVAKAVKAASQTGADLLTIHCSGGPAMLSAAQDSAKGSGLSLLGVTVLTSLGGDDFMSVCSAWGARTGASVPRGAVVLSLAEIAAQSSLSGIVCSASDLHDGEIRKLPWKTNQPLFVTPGIRNASDAVNDQKSVATVEQAVISGSTHLVVGRPITAPQQGDRKSAAASFLKQIRETHVVASHS